MAQINKLLATGFAVLATTSVQAQSDMESARQAMLRDDCRRVYDEGTATVESTYVNFSSSSLPASAKPSAWYDATLADAKCAIEDLIRPLLKDRDRVQQALSGRIDENLEFIRKWLTRA